MQFKIVFCRTSEKDKSPMINIDGDRFTYSYIANMYKDNQPGEGIQVENKSERQALLKLCRKISDAVIEFNQPVSKKSGPCKHFISGMLMDECGCRRQHGEGRISSSGWVGAWRIGIRTGLS